MAQRQGELSLQEAAEALECSQLTVRRWCKDTLLSAKDPGYKSKSPFKNVRRDVGGRYWIARKDVASLLREHEG